MKLRTSFKWIILAIVAFCLFIIPLLILAGVVKFIVELVLFIIFSVAIIRILGIVLDEGE